MTETGGVTAVDDGLFMHMRPPQGTQRGEKVVEEFCCSYSVITGLKEGERGETAKEERRIISRQSLSRILGEFCRTR